MEKGKLQQLTCVQKLLFHCRNFFFLAQRPAGGAPCVSNAGNKVQIRCREFYQKKSLYLDLINSVGALGEGLQRWALVVNLRGQSEQQVVKQSGCVAGEQAVLFWCDGKNTFTCSQMNKQPSTTWVQSGCPYDFQKSPDHFFKKKEFCKWVQNPRTAEWIFYFYFGVRNSLVKFEEYWQIMWWPDKILCWETVCVEG